MNVFVFGFDTSYNLWFSRSCNFIRNYSIYHFAYGEHPRYSVLDNSIIISPELIHFLGRLENLYGGKAFYVYLKSQIVVPTNYGSYFKDEAEYIDEISSRLNKFLRNKNSQEFDITKSLPEKRKQLALFWQTIEAKGEFDKAFDALK